MANVLKELVEVLGGRAVGEGKVVFPCPICQADDKRPSNWKGVITPGRVQIAMVVCRRCGPEMARMLALKGQSSTRFLKKGSPREIGDAWREVTGGAIVQGTLTLADPYFLHEIYRQLLSPMSLIPEHQAWLMERGFSYSVSEQVGYKTWDRPKIDKLVKSYGEELLKVPGFIKKEGEIVLATGRARGIAIPCRNVLGEILAVKIRYPSLTKGRFIQLSSTPSGPPGKVVIHWPLNAATNLNRYKKIRVTEGERKADLAFYSTGIPTVALPGTGFVKQLKKELIGRGNVEEVILAFDQDPAGRSAAISAAALLADNFRITAEVWDENHKGIDDAIANGAEIRRDVDGEFLELWGDE